ncbi:MAG: YceI family protein [Persicimonas sp.]
MKTRNLLMIALFPMSTLLFSTSVFAQEKSYQVDPVHSNVVFRVKHSDLAYVYGQFLKFDGSVDYNADKPSATSIEWTVDADSVFTNHRKRDGHLKSPDFFNAKQHPKISFKSTKVTKKGDKLRVKGKLTLNGKTRTVSTDVELTGSGKDQEGNPRLGFLSEFSIDRSDFGMDFMVGPVSDQVDLTVSTEVVSK